MRLATLAMLCVAALAGCTKEQFYASGRDWQRSQCAKIIDRWEYDRCIRDADLAYEEYMRRKEAEDK